MISALQRDETDGILKSLYKKAKPGEWKFKSQEVTNLSLDERAHEIVREKVFKYFSKVFSCCFAFLLHSKFRSIGRCRPRDGTMECIAKRFPCRTKLS